MTFDVEKRALELLPDIGGGLWTMYGSGYARSQAVGAVKPATREARLEAALHYHRQRCSCGHSPGCFHADYCSVRVAMRVLGLP